jgi:Acyl-CoA synthetases (AMP-forming)/AMP-acid ligases II
VIGIPDDKWGEAVKAIVVMKPGKSGDRNRHHQFCPRTHRGLQDAEVGRFHGRAAAQSVGQDLAAEFRDPYWAGKDRQVN